jgi:hypothetical protein
MYVAGAGGDKFLAFLRVGDVAAFKLTMVATGFA